MYAISIFYALNTDFSMMLRTVLYLVYPMNQAVTFLCKFYFIYKQLLLLSSCQLIGSLKYCKLHIILCNHLKNLRLKISNLVVNSSEIRSFDWWNDLVKCFICHIFNSTKPLLARPCNQAYKSYFWGVAILRRHVVVQW